MRTAGATMLRLLAMRIALAVALVISAGTGAALAVTCPESPASDDRVFSVDTVGATCVDYGPGNINGDNSDFPGYVYLDKWTRDSGDASTGSNVNGLLTITITNSKNTAGTFTISAPGYSSLLIAFKSGEGQADPDWAGFLLPTDTTMGGWTITLNQALSHANLYGVVASVPLPAGISLLGAGLLGLGLIGWRKRSALRAA